MNPNLQPYTPNQQPPKRRFSSSQLTAIIIVGVIFGSCALCGIVSGISNYLNPPTQSVTNSSAPSPIADSSSPIASNSVSPSPTSTPPARSRMVQNLAIIEGVQRDEAKIARISTLLSQLDARYPENEEQIGDMTAGAYREITRRGNSASIIEIMEAMMTVSEGNSGTSYADAITLYALLRVNGMR